jgi:glycerophosphoryl diester phosphodiesterase
MTFRLITDTVAGRWFLLAVMLLGWANQGEAQMITAHRGASYDAPENTLAAFRLAWEQDADAIEGDFYLTADGQIVCIHDKDTRRTAGATKVIEQSTLEELRTLEVGKWKSRKYAGELIPTFAEVMATVPSGKQFVIELKSTSKIVPVLASELQRLKPDRERLLIISFDAPSIAKCKELMPDIRAHWLTGFKADESGKMQPTADAIAKTVKQCQADGVGLKGVRSVIDQAFANELVAKGCAEFHVWTIDDIADAKYFRSLGAVGITTNRPRYVRDGILQ